MSEDANKLTEEKAFCVDRAKQGRAACKKCKEKCVVGELRIAKVVPSPFGTGKMKNWHHLNCIFEQFLKQRVSTKRIESPDDLDGWDDLTDEDKDELLSKIKETEKIISDKHGNKATPKNQAVTSTAKVTPKKKVTPKSETTINAINSPATDFTNTIQNNTDSNIFHKDLFFREFRKLVADISNVTSYTDKTNIVKAVFTKGSDGKSFKGNIAQWCRLLLPGVVKRVYNLQSKQLVKLFSRIFHTDQAIMIEHLKQGDIGETIQLYFEESKKFRPAKKSLITIQEVDDFLEELSQLTKEEDQINHLKSVASRCTSNDLKIIVRLIKHDLRMNAGAKHILQAIHPDAYSVYQASKDLEVVITRCLCGLNKTSVERTSRVKADITILTPVQPMLAESCRSIEQAMKKCPNGMYAEIKYDGERVQLHKQGNEFKYFSRSLKPVFPHKVAHFKEYITKAFPHVNDLILDSEILMIDTITGKPLPFGTLGIHKKTEFKDANVCLFVFDCIYYNGESLIKKSIDYRKKILMENMTEIPHHILFSEIEEITNSKQLSDKISSVLASGLEGLVLKDRKSLYEPGKRHWLKIKKDYLLDGAIADTADLIVLGAWYGTGRKAGLKSVFLMGCYNEELQTFCTVTKVHTGHDDKTLQQLQDELKMIEIKCDSTKVPSWLKCTKTMIPDFVAEDPKHQPVWEITGAEFTQHEVHTADGISIRFPRVTRIRNDKNWKSATTLEELKVLYHKSKEETDVKLLMEINKESDVNPVSIAPTKNRNKRSHSPSSDDSIQPKMPKINDANDVKINDQVVEIVEPLPNLFKTVKLLIEPGGEDEFEKQLRLFVAYGGVILKADNWKEATHVLHLEDRVREQGIPSPKTAHHIIVEWLSDSITHKQLQDFRPYSVRWEPFNL